MSVKGKQLRYLLKSAENIGLKEFGRLLAPLEITPNQSEVLLVLNDYQPLSLKALGELLVCEEKSPSRLVKGLIQKGLAAKETSSVDRRHTLLSLTEAGKNLIPKIKEAEELFDHSMEERYPELGLFNNLLSDYAKGTLYEQKLRQRSLWPETKAGEK